MPAATISDASVTIKASERAVLVPLRHQICRSFST
jgi:hypothetical protein